MKCLIFGTPETGTQNQQEMPRSTADFAIGPPAHKHNVYAEEYLVAGTASRMPRNLRCELGTNDDGRVGLNCSRPTWSSCDTGQVEAELRNIRGVDRRSPVDDIKYLGVSRVSDGNREFCSEGGFDKSRKQSHVRKHGHRTQGSIPGPTADVQTLDQCSHTSEKCVCCVWPAIPWLIVIGCHEQLKS